jgi:MFS family permease
MGWRVATRRAVEAALPQRAFGEGSAMHATSINPGSGRWLALGLITLTRASMGYQFQAVASTAPQLRADLGLDHTFIGMLVGLYLLPGVALAFPGGLLGRRFGDRHIVLAGLTLMTAGGLTMALAETAGVLTVGRLVAGAGGVLLNVLLAKMIADWFEGREMFVAMSTMINAWPIGIALALVTLGPISVAASWEAAMLLTTAVCAFALLTFSLCYRDAPRIASSAATWSDLVRIPRRETGLVLLAGAIWSIYNAALVVLLAFLASHLVDRGMSFVQAGFVMSIWMLTAVIALQAGGILVQRIGHTQALTVLGLSVCGVGTILLPWLPLPAVVIIVTAVFGVAPAGVLVAQPALILSAQHRAPGMGLFYTLFYLGVASLPPLAGWLFDASGTSAAPVVFAGVAILACAPGFILLQRRAGFAGAPAPAAAPLSR